MYKTSKTIKGQILTYEVVAVFCFTVKRITFFSISKNIILVQQKLDEKYQIGNTVPSTCNCYYFITETTSLIKGKQLSEDLVFSITQTFLNTSDDEHTQMVSSLKAINCKCQYDHFWWLALI